MSHRRIAITLAALLAFSSGCSLAVKDAPTRTLVGQRVDCTESRNAPAVDTTAGVLFGVLGAGAIASDWNYQSKGDNQAGLITGVGIGLVAVGVIYGLSAWHGYRATGRCRNLQSQRIALR